MNEDLGGYDSRAYRPIPHNPLEWQATHSSPLVIAHTLTGKGTAYTITCRIDTSSREFSTKLSTNFPLIPSGGSIRNQVLRGQHKALQGNVVNKPCVRS